MVILLKLQKSSICSECGRSSSTNLHIYEEMENSIHIQQLFDSNAKHNIQICLYCDECLRNVIPRENQYLNQLIKECESNNLKIKNQGIERQKLIQQFNKDIDILKDSLEQKSKEVREYQDLVGNKQCKYLLQQINFQEIQELFMCMKELSLEIKEQYSEEIQSEIFKFDNQEESCEIIVQNFKDALKNLLCNILNEIEQKISKDIKVNQQNERKIKQLHTKFLKKYEEAIDDGMSEVHQKFSNYLLQQYNEQKIKGKKSSLDKVQFIKEMTMKLLN